MSSNGCLKWIVVALVGCSVASIVMASDADYAVQLNLNDKLLTGYKKDNRPSFEVDVNITVFINQIISIDDSNQQMKSSINIMATWVDSRLKWSLSDYNVEYTQIKADSLWLPDLVVLNSASTSIFLSMDSKSISFVSNNGEVAVLYSVPSLLTRCLMDVTKFPMDKQSCKIRFSSWALCEDLMNIIIEEVVTEFYTENAVWSLDTDSISSSYTHEKDRYSYQDNGCLMDVASIILPLTRRPLYYMINMIFPSFILTIVTIVCFALPSALQFSISLTIFLNYSITSVRIASLMPVQSTNTPVVTWYFFGSMMLTLTSFLWFVADFTLRSFAYLPGWVSLVCIKIRKWSRFIKSKWTACECKCKKKVNVVENANNNGDQVEFELEKKPMPPPPAPPEPTHGCIKCQSCGKCKEKEQEKKANDNKKSEFDKNMLCLNRIVFSISLGAIVIFNLACWIYIGSD